MDFTFPSFTRASTDLPFQQPPQKSLLELVIEAKGRLGLVPQRKPEKRQPGASFSAFSDSDEEGGETTGNADGAAADTTAVLTTQTAWVPPTRLLDYFFSGPFMQAFLTLHGVASSRAAAALAPPVFSVRDVQLHPAVESALCAALRETTTRGGGGGRSGGGWGPHVQPSSSSSFPTTATAALPLWEAARLAALSDAVFGDAAGDGAASIPREADRTAQRTLFRGVQQVALPALLLGDHVLVSGPHGVGKRTAALLALAANALTFGDTTVVAKEGSEESPAAEVESHEPEASEGDGHTESQPTTQGPTKEIAEDETVVKPESAEDPTAVPDAPTTENEMHGTRKDDSDVEGSSTVQPVAPQALIVVSSYGEVLAAAHWLETVFGPEAFAPYTFDKDDCTLRPLFAADSIRNSNNNNNSNNDVVGGGAAYLMPPTAVPPLPFLVDTTPTVAVPPTDPTQAEGLLQASTGVLGEGAVPNLSELAALVQTAPLPSSLTVPATATTENEEKIAAQKDRKRRRRGPSDSRSNRSDDSSDENTEKGRRRSPRHRRHHRHHHRSRRHRYSSDDDSGAEGSSVDSRDRARRSRSSRHRRHHHRSGHRSSRHHRSHYGGGDDSDSNSSDTSSHHRRRRSRSGEKATEMVMKTTAAVVHETATAAAAAALTVPPPTTVIDNDAPLPTTTATALEDAVLHDPRAWLPAALRRGLPVLVTTYHALQTAMATVDGEASALPPLEHVRVATFVTLERALAPPLKDTFSHAWWVSLVNALDVGCQVIATADRGGTEVMGFLTSTVIPDAGERLMHVEQRDTSIWALMDVSVYPVPVEASGTAATATAAAATATSDDRRRPRISGDDIDAAKLVHLFSRVSTHLADVAGDGESGVHGGRVVVACSNRREQSRVVSQLGQLFNEADTGSNHVGVTDAADAFRHGAAAVLVLTDAQMADGRVLRELHACTQVDLIVHFSLPRSVMTQLEKSAVAEVLAQRGRAILGPTKPFCSRRWWRTAGQPGAAASSTFAPAKVTCEVMLTEHNMKGRVGTCVLELLSEMNEE